MANPFPQLALPVLTPTTAQPTASEPGPVQDSVPFQVQNPEERIPVRDPIGRVVTLPARQVKEAFETGGFSPATTGELQAQRDKDYYDQPLQQAAAFSEGALRGGTLGLYDPIMREIAGPEYMQEAAARKAQNPTTEFVGQGVGMLASAVAGGAAAGAQGAPGLVGAFSPTEALGAVGGAAEELSARGLGALGVEGMAARVIPQVAKNAAEGALLSEGQYLSESALGDHDMRAQEMLAAAGGGALVGGGIGLGLGLGGQAARAARAMFPETGSALGKQLTESSFDQIAKARAVNKGFEATGGSGKVISELKQGLPQYSVSPEDYQNMAAEIIFKRAPEVLGKSEASMLSAADQVKAYEALLNNNNKKLFDYYGDLVRSNERIKQELIISDPKGMVPKGMVETGQLVDVVRKQAADSFSTVGAKAERKILDGWANDVEKTYESGNMNVLEAHQEIVKLEELENKALSKNNYEKANAYKTISSILDRKLDTATQQTLKEKFILKFVGGKITSGQFNRAFEGNAFKLRSDHLWQTRIENHFLNSMKRAALKGAESHPSVFGDISGVLLGSSIGSMFNPFAGAVGAVGGFVTHQFKQMGPSIEANLAYRLSKNGMGILDTAQNFSKKISNGVASSLSTEVPNAVRRQTIERLSPEQYGELRSSLMGRFQDKTKLSEQVASSGLYETHPNIAKALYQRAQAANDFLASKLPPAIDRPSLTGPHSAFPPENERRKFEKYLNAVKNPLGVLDDLRDGRVSPESVETLKTVYPGIYGEVKAQLTVAAAGKVSKQKSEVPYDRKIALGLLFETALDPTATPEYVAAMRASSSQQKSNVAAVRPPSLTQMHTPQRQTRTERIASH